MLAPAPYSPNGARSFRFALLAGAALACAAACSFLLPFDPEGQPCDALSRCLEGYHCIDKHCMKSSLDGGPESDGGTFVACDDRCSPTSATRIKPNLMLLVDKSGSLDLPMDPTLTACRPLADGGVCGVTKTQLCDLTTCATRWSELQKGLTAFVNGRATVARMGLTTFPNNDQCGSPTSARLEIVNSQDVDAELVQKGEQIKTELSAIRSDGGLPGTANATGGGSPTGSALRMLGALTSLNDVRRDDYVLLATDGVPFCNGANPNTCMVNATACKCPATGIGCTGPMCTLGCLDADGTSAAIASLKLSGIRTAVLAVGPESLTGDTPTALTAMANAGDFVATCPNGSAAECGPGSACDGTTCSLPYFRATTPAELTTALETIAKRIETTYRCSYFLDAPPADSRRVHVFVDSQEVGQGPTTWTYSSGRVTFHGPICAGLASGVPPVVAFKLAP